MKGLPYAMAHQNVFRTREGGGAKPLVTLSPQTSKILPVRQEYLWPNEDYYSWRGQVHDD